MAIGETKNYSDLERRVKYLCSERGVSAHRTTSDSGSGAAAYTLTKAIDNSLVGSANAVIATVQTFARVIDPTV